MYIRDVALHHRILETAVRLCRAAGGWTFRPQDVVAALADLNAGSVRTHVMSRCCVNAPANHQHRWPYFRRVSRGLYEILPRWRRSARRQPAPGAPAALVARYMRDVDRTLVRQALLMTHEQRLTALQDWIDATSEARGAVGRPSRRRAS